METLYFIVDFFGHHVIFFDGLLLILGLTVGRAKEFSVFIRVAVLMVKMAQWYFKTHPHGRTAKNSTQIDEKLTGIYNKHLAKYDIVAIDSHLSPQDQGMEVPVNTNLGEVPHG